MNKKRILLFLKMAFLIGIAYFLYCNIYIHTYACPDQPTAQLQAVSAFNNLAEGKNEFLYMDGKITLQAEKNTAGGDQGAIVWRNVADQEKWRLNIGIGYYWRNITASTQSIILGLLALLSFFVCASFSSVRWWWLLRANGLAVGLFEAWRLMWVGVFFNNVVPGLTGGDLIKAFYIAKHTGQKTIPILTVIVDRILGLASLALLAMVVILINFSRFSILAWGLLGVLVVLAGLTLLFFSRRIRKTLRLGALLRRLPGSGILMQVDEALTLYRNKKAAITFWLITSMINHILSTGIAALLGYAMVLQVSSWVDYFALVPVINIASAVPIAPAGWGVGEALYGELFQRYAGLGFSEGVGLSVLTRILMTLWSFLGGIFYLMMKDRVSTRIIEQEMGAGDDSLPASGSEDQAGTSA